MKDYVLLEVFLRDTKLMLYEFLQVYEGFEGRFLVRLEDLRSFTKSIQALLPYVIKFLRYEFYLLFNLFLLLIKVLFQGLAIRGLGIRKLFKTSEHQLGHVHWRLIHRVERESSICLI